MHKIPIHVLLVEDSRSDAKLLHQTLSRSNNHEWDLIHVERLSDALDAYRTYPLDVVLLDLSLPDSEGLDTVAKFHISAPDVPIVVLTGFDDEEFALQAVSKGAQDYLVKGQITTQLLVRAIRYAIEREEIVKQLQESERRFREIFEQTFQAMGLLTPEGMLLEINQTAFEIYGLKPEDVVGVPMWELKTWNYSQESQEWLKVAIANAANGQFVRHEIQMQKAGGAMVWLDFSLKPLKDERGNVVMLIAEGRNISERKQAEAEILKTLEQEQELNHLKTNFVSMVSHEFRTPMTIIQTSTQMLQNYNDKLTSEQKKKHFDRIQTVLSNFLHLLDEVLLLGKTEGGGLQYKPTSLDLENFCRELTETLQFSTGSKHKIFFIPRGECQQVDMDEVLLHHILTNLLCNAIKYSPQGGNIWLDLICQDGIATFQVRDEGIGIPLKDQQRLFQAFQRCSNVGQIRGTGLGLSIVKRCVDLQRGQIKVESEEGAGTTFTVTLPSSNSKLTNNKIYDSPVAL